VLNEKNTGILNFSVPNEKNTGILNFSVPNAKNVDSIFISFLRFATMWTAVYSDVILVGFIKSAVISRSRKILSSEPVSVRVSSHIGVRENQISLAGILSVREILGGTRENVP